MNELMWLVIAVITVTAVIKCSVLVYDRRKLNSTVSQSSNRDIVPVGNITPSANETGPMVYYANNRHNLRDKEYQFNYKNVNGCWRAYILRMPSLGNRDTNGHSTHRLWDGDRPYVCWDCPVNSLKDMQTISRVWADSIQEYIATGKKFG